MGDLIHSGYKLFNRWGEEPAITKEMAIAVRNDYPLPLLEGDY
jgi:hypothetical protein